MKTKLFLLLVTTIIWSCNQPATTDSGNVESGKAHDEHRHENTVSGLTLNNGVKWDADESTNTNVKQLEEILSRFSAVENRTLESYLNAGAELQKSIESLIQGCRMQGADHDALHVWLEPLMMKVKDLNASADVNEASRLFEDIYAHVSLYKEYFE